MTYSSVGELIEILKKENLWADKSLGQNFLVNTGVVEKILDAAGVTETDRIVEVGPGLGILTQALLSRAGRVHSIELDRAIFPYLEKTFGNNPKFHLEKGTALKAALPTEPYKLVANIPYYITSPLLTHYLNPPEPLPAQPAPLRPQTVVILVQLEVAQKICAGPGNHSILSLMTQIFGKPEIITKVSKNNFYPAPKVDSAVLRITTYESPLITDLKLFKQLISICFHQKRKTLLNTLQNFTPGGSGKSRGANKADTRAQTANILQTADIDGSARPQDLSLEDWQRLMSAVSEQTQPHTN